uniref:Putative 4-amino-4-deoxy-l-arabinose-phosphoundecaprenol flippase subunit arnf n=2 Tax=Anopheles triannulatus TaxID=58253 RepID=A0A2M4AJ49_9DIPT
MLVRMLGGRGRRSRLQLRLLLLVVLLQLLLELLMVMLRLERLRWLMVRMLQLLLLLLLLLMLLLPVICWRWSLPLIILNLIYVGTGISGYIGEVLLQLLLERLMRCKLTVHQARRWCRLADLVCGLGVSQPGRH